MQLPIDPALPFFAYGALRPGKLSYFRIQPFVECAKETVAPGDMYVRDGLLIADQAGRSEISGHLLHFQQSRNMEAYKAICDLEPSSQYRWGTVNTTEGNANILWGVSPRKGSVALDFKWSSWDDPLFTTALAVVKEQLQTYAEWEKEGKNSFHLQMAYLLLWTSIERYASLRYHLKRDATDKVIKVAAEHAFASKLQEVVKEKRSIQRADDPTKKIELDPYKPEKAILYYYQVRSNMVHRGKGMPKDHTIVRSSCCELLAIFDHLLFDARAKSESV